MKKNSSMVQTIVLVVFGLGIILGVLFFSGKVPLPGDKKKTDGPTGSVVIWGVLPYSQMSSFLDGIEQSYDELELSYIEKKSETIQTDLVNALASGKGPDIFMMNSQQVAENLDRLYIIPYETIPESVYQKTYADIGDSLLISNGIIGLPMIIDPMVLYYNKDIFTSNFEVDPPKTWDKLTELVPKLVKKDEAGKISQAAIALGTVNNNSHTKEILALKMLQDGNPIVHFSSQINKWQSDIESGGALVSALYWYTGFMNPVNNFYTWNTSLPNDRDMFTAGKSGMYIGYPTELETIRKLNPNLNFGMAMIPQKSSDARKTNYAQVYSLGISKISKNRNNAVAVALLLTNKENLAKLVSPTYYAPARRDLLNDKPNNNDITVTIYNSAIISKSFFDPNSTKTKDAFVSAINQINSGQKGVEQSLLPITTSFREITAKLKLPKN